MLASSHGLIKQAEGYVPAFRSIHSGSLALRLSANSSLMAGSKPTTRGQLVRSAARHPSFQEVR